MKHGDCIKKRTRLYIIWSNIKQRCNNKKSISYKYYGNKGIKVCEIWKNSYIEFKVWALNNGYRNGLVIDRKKNNKGYNPSNCRWVTVKRNNRNQTKTILSTERANQIRSLYFNVRISRKLLSKLFDVSYWTICDVINNRRWID